MNIRTIFALGVVGLALLTAQTRAAEPGLSFLGVGSLPGNATDLSGLSGTVANADGSSPIPANQLGAFGSALAYTGFGSRYLAVDDRGYDNGLTNYADRMQVFDVTVDPRTGAVTPTLVDTRLLTDEAGRNFLGTSAAFTTPDPSRDRRLDPEGVRVAPDGTFYVSDEYGPSVYHFSAQGRRIGTVPVPAKFRVATLSTDADTEIKANTSGRVANRGLEGLAISPDGGTLFAIMQSPLIQDGGRKGVNNRILKIDLATGKTSEYVYRMDDAKYGVSEILALNDHEFLVDERDGKAGVDARFKEIYRIDLAGATDVGGVRALPAAALPAGVRAVRKSPFLNLLDPGYGLAGATFPEKIEGLAFGPDFMGGDHLLLVTNDNDLITANPSNFYAFRIALGALSGYRAQRVKTPFVVTRRK